MKTVVIGIDASAQKPGFAILARGKFVAAGVVRRQDGEGDLQHAARAGSLIREILVRGMGGRWEAWNAAIEIQRGPIPAVRRKALLWCIECRGRLLQELGVADPIRIQASREKKPDRRRRIELKYPAARKPTGQPLPEDAIDALAVADAAWAEIVVRQHAKGS